MPAHILTAGGGLGLLGWAPAAIGVAAIAVVAFGPRRFQRPAVVVSVVSMSSLLILAAVSPGAPLPPGYAITVLEPGAGGAVTTPFSVVVCGRSSAGSSAAVPGGDRVLSISLDGREVLSTGSGHALVTATPGRHRLRVEVLTKDHVEYQPPLAQELDVEVGGPAPIAAPRSCP